MHSVSCSREELCRRIQLLPESQLALVVNFVDRIEADDDEPLLTLEEERAFEIGRDNLKQGDTLTLEEFKKQVAEL